MGGGYYKGENVAFCRLSKRKRWWWVEALQIMYKSSNLSNMYNMKPMSKIQIIRMTLILWICVDEEKLKGCKDFFLNYDFPEHLHRALTKKKKKVKNEAKTNKPKKKKISTLPRIQLQWKIESIFVNFFWIKLFALDLYCFLSA